MNSPVAGHCFLKYPSKDERCKWTRIIKVLTDKCKDQGRRSNRQNIHTGIEREEKYIDRILYTLDILLESSNYINGIVRIFFFI